MRKLLPVLNIMGLLLMVFSLTFLMPIVTSYIYQDGTLAIFVREMVVTFIIGFMFYITTRRFRRELKRRDGFLLVVLAWISMAATAALPLTGIIPGLSFTDAFFETISALTTTGATVLVGLDTLQPAANLWRHELNWIGGMGIIVLAIAILPMLGVGGMQMFKAETPGPMKEDKLTPRITETAKGFWYIYAGLTLLCIIALRIAGMSWFDAICHAFSVMCLGGFSTHDSSVGFFNSPAIEAVMIVFMLISGINFATHFLAFHRRSLKSYLMDSEAKGFLFIVLASCVGTALFLMYESVYRDFFTALRHASFNVVSIATTSGFASVDFNQWPIYLPLWMLFLAGISTSSGSTGGGIKMIRTMLLYKQGLREMQRLIHPQVISTVKIGGRVIPNNVVFSVLGFIFLYFMSLLVVAFLLMITGLDFVSALTAALATINNTGPGLNLVGPATNYQILSDAQTWICSFAMLLGRLEIFTLLILFTPSFWRK
ncbi:MAG TPA: potassium transporter TrkG [Gammaproteobacteria bacterium]